MITDFSESAGYPSSVEKAFESRSSCSRRKGLSSIVSLMTRPIDENYDEEKIPRIALCTDANDGDLKSGEKGSVTEGSPRKREYGRAIAVYGYRTVL